MYGSEKRFLNQYRVCMKRIRTLEEQEATLRSAISSATVQQITDMPRGGVPPDMAEAICNLQVLLEAIDIERHASLEIMAEIERTIRAVEDPIEQRVLHLRYLRLMRWESIYDKIGYSRAQTHRMHGRALKNLNQMIQDEIV